MPWNWQLGNQDNGNLSLLPVKKTLAASATVLQLAAPWEEATHPLTVMSSV